MMIKKFWAKGYRSLHDVAFDGLGKFNAFYGPNGSGKSNVLDAIQTFFYLMPLAVDTAYGPEDERISYREGGRRATEWIGEDDFYAREDTSEIEIGAVIEDPGRFSGASFQGQPVRRVEVALRFWRVRPGEYALKIVRLFINHERPGLPFTDPTIRDLLQRFVPQEFTHLGVMRTLSVKASGDSLPSSSRGIDTISEGDVVRELFRAKNAKDKNLRNRFEELRTLMATMLRKAGRLDIARTYLDAAANASDTKALEQVLRNVDLVCQGRGPNAKMPTIRELGESWTRGDLARDYPDHVRVKKSVGHDISRLENYVYPVVGDIRIDTFTLDHVRIVMRGITEGRAVATRRQVAQLLHRICKMAVFPLQLIATNPLPSGFLPKIGPGKAKGWVYPWLSSLLPKPFGLLTIHPPWTPENWRRKRRRRLESSVESSVTRTLVHLSLL